MNKEENRSRLRPSIRRGSKVPLTYYRSAGKRLDDSEPQIKKDSTARKIRRFFGSVLGWTITLAIIVGLVDSLIVSPDPKIVLSSETYHPASAYTNAAHKYLNTLTNRNKITLNEQSIASSLQKQFPEITRVDIELPIAAHTPIIRLNIAQPSFVLGNNGKLYIIDSQGVAVSKTGQNNDLTVVADNSGFVAKLGQQVMSAEQAQFVTNLLAQLQHAKVPVKTLTLPSQAEELDLQTTDKPYFVKFFMGGNILTQAGQYIAARHQFDSTNAQPSQYLDVRVPGKIFYL